MPEEPSLALLQGEFRSDIGGPVTLSVDLEVNGNEFTQVDWLHSPLDKGFVYSGKISVEGNEVVLHYSQNRISSKYQIYLHEGKTYLVNEGAYYSGVVYENKLQKQFVKIEENH